MMPFCNNLRKDDTVEIAANGRRGRVVMQPRESSRSVCVLLDGVSSWRYIPVADVRLVVGGVAETVPPIDGEIPRGGAPAPATLPVAPTFEARCQPLKVPAHAVISGEHLKHYLVTYIREDGQFHVEKVAAPGIMQSITLFYRMHAETAIVSVVCVL